MAAAASPHDIFRVRLARYLGGSDNEVPELTTNITVEELRSWNIESPGHVLAVLRACLSDTGIYNDSDYSGSSNFTCIYMFMGIKPSSEILGPSVLMNAHPFTCGICSWGRDGAYHGYGEYEEHMAAAHPEV